MNSSYRFFAGLAVAILFAAVSLSPAGAQDVVPAPDSRPSPLAIVRTTLDNGTHLKVHYGSPRMRDREIFGGLVPAGQVWRLGANEATEMTVTSDVSFGGEQLPAGTYSLFANPKEDAWTIIVNKNLGQWGAFSYEEEQDLLRVDVPVEQADDIHEAFTISLNKSEAGNGADMVMVWDRTKVVVPIRAD